MKYFLALGLGLGLFASLPAHGQTPPDPIEVSPFVGYLFGGSYMHLPMDDDLPGVSVADHLDFGIRVGFNLSSTIEPEIQWTRSDTHLKGTAGVPSPPGWPVTIDYILGGVNYNFSARTIRPYVSLSLGAARFANIRQIDFTQSGVSPATNFAGSVATGVKVFLTPQVGLRFEARGYASEIPHDFFIPCTTFDSGGTPVSCNRKWLLDGDLTGGVVVAF